MATTTNVLEEIAQENLGVYRASPIRLASRDEARLIIAKRLQQDGRSDIADPTLYFGPQFFEEFSGLSTRRILELAQARQVILLQRPVGDIRRKGGDKFPLCDLLEARYDLPVCLHVDVDAALLGEYHYGAGKGYHRLLYLTLNAVVGAALFIDGQLERSPHASVGHISHVPVSANGPRCSCGKRGCINSFVSLDAIQKMVQRALRRGEETSLAQRLNNREYFSPQLLAEEAVRGDAVALQVYAEVGRWLSEATARYIALFEPHALILGGSVLNASEYLFASMQSTLIMHASTSVDTPIKVVLAHLGNDAGLIGTTVPLFQNSGKLKTSVPASSLSPVSSEQ